MAGFDLGDVRVGVGHTHLGQLKEKSYALKYTQTHIFLYNTTVLSANVYHVPDRKRGKE